MGTIPGKEGVTIERKRRKHGMTVSFKRTASEGSREYFLDGSKAKGVKRRMFQAERQNMCGAC